MTKDARYDDKFKESAVRLSYRYGNIMKAARELNVPYTLLYGWRKEYSLMEFDLPGKKTRASASASASAPAPAPAPAPASDPAHTPVRPRRNRR